MAATLIRMVTCQPRVEPGQFWGSKTSSEMPPPSPHLPFLPTPHGHIILAVSVNHIQFGKKRNFHC